MLPRCFRFALLFAGLIASCSTASAQINFNVTYDDGPIQAGGIGFADPTVVGSTTKGQLARNSITAAFNYLNTVYDGRGTVNVDVQASLNSSSNPLLGEFGPTGFVGLNGSFQNGQAYQVARTNNRPFSNNTVDIQGQFNFGHLFNYFGQTPDPNNYDITSVAIHELTHGFGFLSGTLQDGSGRGLAGQTLGSPDVYSGFDRFIQRGNSGTGNLFNTNIASSSYGSFANPSFLNTLTNGNDPTTGLFYGGQYTREVLNASAALFAPASYEPGSSTSHVNDANAVMNPTVLANTVKRYQSYEIAMMLDIGWNVYNWNSTTGNWLDGVVGTTLTVANSHWQTDSGIVYDGSHTYNTNATPGQAPVLPPYAQVTSNIVLNFAGSGSTAYTTSNDIGNVRISRLNLNSTASVAETIQNASSNSAGMLIFGLNSDGSPSVLAPKIVQQNSGAFVINANIQTNNIAAFTTPNTTTTSTFQGWAGLTIDGTGTGQVTLGGTISGGISSLGGFNGTTVTGSLTKAGSFTVVLTGNNTYGGGTTINAGTLLVNGQSAGNSGTGTGSVTVNGGGTFGGTGTVAGAVIVNGGATGGTIRGGFAGNTGMLTVANNVNIGNGAANAALLFEASRTGAGTASASLLSLTGSASVLNLNPGSGNKFLIDLVNGTSILQANETYTVTLASVATAGNIQLNGTSISASTAIASSNFTLQSSAFANFNNVSLSTDSTDKNLVLAFTPLPVPEPGAILGIAFGVLGLGSLAVRRLRGSSPMSQRIATPVVFRS